MRIMEVESSSLLYENTEAKKLTKNNTIQ